MIPKGVATARSSGCAGSGRARPGIDPGDVLLTIDIAPHDVFVPEGANLRLRLPIELDEAILGGKVRVQTLTGSVEMTIPAMTDSGRTFRLRGKGLPSKGGHGDLLVTTEIRLPADADEALAEYARKRRAAKTA